MDSEEFALGILKGQLRGLPASAENIHAHYESHPVGSVLFGCLEAPTSDLEAALDRSPALPMSRQLFETGPAKDWLHNSRSFYAEKRPWWKPERASRFGRVIMVKHYSDGLSEGDTPTWFYKTTQHWVGLGDIGNGRSVLYLLVRWAEPEQDRSGTVTLTLRGPKAGDYTFRSAAGCKRAPQSDTAGVSETGPLVGESSGQNRGRVCRHRDGGFGRWENETS